MQALPLGRYSTRVREPRLDLNSTVRLPLPSSPLETGSSF